MADLISDIIVSAADIDLGIDNTTTKLEAKQAAYNIVTTSINAKAKVGTIPYKLQAKSLSIKTFNKDVSSNINLVKTKADVKIIVNSVILDSKEYHTNTNMSVLDINIPGLKVMRLPEIFYTQDYFISDYAEPGYVGTPYTL